MKHLVSFIRGPLGYILNLLATLLVYGERLHEPSFYWAGEKLSHACELICLRDGVQDEPLW